MTRTKRKKLRGTVKKLIKPSFDHETEKAEIVIEEADPLYQEIRVENALTDENGAKEKLKSGAEVNVVIEADSDATKKEGE